MQLSGFSIEEVLHHGADSTVWEATERATGRRVAIKRAQSDEATLREAQRLQRAQGDGVIELVGVVQTDEGSAMQLALAGDSLKNRLRAQGPLELREALEIARALARTLSRLHGAGVLHRDIKPSNLLAAEDARGWLLIDFGVAAQLDKDADQLESRGFVGSAPYVAPEQTGRIGRGVDARADLYSLGVTLYELLAGEPPFTGDSMMELVAAHINREPPSLELRVPGLPPVVAAIVHKLLRKQPEARYQSAVGLAEDLARCLETLQPDGAVARFELARSDQLPLRIPEPLFGRDRELRALLEFSRGCRDGRAGLVNLIAAPGFGRTRLVHELLNTLSQEGFLCLRATPRDDGSRAPLWLFQTALTALARQLLLRSDEQLTRWRGELNEALGGLGGVILELAPELAAVLGDCPPLEELPPAKARTRFTLGVLRLLRGLSTPEHPLALYIADLERHDAASRELLGALLERLDREAITLIVGCAAPPRREERDLETLELELGAMPIEGIYQLLRAALAPDESAGEGEGEDDAAQDRYLELARVIERKTEGRPAHIAASLRHLARLGALRRVAGQWTWSIEQIINAPAPDSLADTILTRARACSPDARAYLEAAACLGGPFVAADVAAVLDVDEHSSKQTLWELLGAGALIVSAEGDAAALDFPHPAVPRGVLERLTPTRARRLHEAVSFLLLESLDKDARRERIFEITAHLDEVERFPQASRRELALNAYALAGSAALRTTSYEAAHAALKRALRLLPDDAERSQRSLWLTLHVDAARTAYASDDFSVGERLIELLLARELAPDELARVLKIRLQAYEVAARYKDTLELGAAALTRLGVKIPLRVSTARLLFQVLRNKRLVDGMTEGRLRALPSRDDPVADAAGQIITAMGAAGYYIDPKLMLYYGELALTQALTAGADSNTAGAFRSHAIAALTILRDHPRAVRMQQISEVWAERYPDADADHRARGSELIMIKPFVTDPREMIGEFEGLLRTSVELGDTIYANYSLNLLLESMTWAGRPLAELITTHARALELVTSWNARAFIPVIQASDDFTRAAADGELTERHLDGLRAIPAVSERYTVAARAGFIAVLCDYTELALPYILEAARRIPKHVPGVFYVVWGTAVAGLAAALAAHRRTRRRRRALLRVARRHQRATANFVALYPGRYEHMNHLIEAELARLDGRQSAALGHYELARAHAERCGFTPLLGLVVQRHMSMLSTLGLHVRAEALREPAIELLLAWGARARAESLIAGRPRQRRGGVSDPDAGTYSTASTRSTRSANSSHSSRSSRSGRSGAGLSINDSLDLHSVLGASQAISEELSVDGVLARVLAGVVENTGARRALLALDRDGELIAEARLTDGRFERLGTPARELADAPQSLLRLASRQRQRFVIEDASSDESVQRDPYVLEAACRSLMVTPILRKGEFIGLLLLENALISGAFTEERVKVVDILGAQAAISIDNAQLYDELEARVARRTAELADRNAAMRLVLDNVDQGFITLDRDARISSERSTIVSRWFGDACDGTFEDFLARTGHDELAEWFALSWESVTDGVLPLEVAVAQLPRRFTLGAQHFQIGWRPIVDDEDEDELVNMLVVLTDITVDLAREASDRRAHEHLRVFQRMYRDPVGFGEFLDEAARLVNQISREHDAAPADELAWKKRWIHTLKGNCSIFGVDSVASICAEIERELAESCGALQPEQAARLADRWRDIIELVNSVGGGGTRELRISRDELEALLQRALVEAPALAEELRVWLLEPIEDRFERLAEQARALALRLGKPPIEIEIEADELRLDPDHHRELWSNMVHAVRNAVDHGVEEEELRLARGKPAAGQLRLSARHDGERLVLAIADDGGGVDWDAIRERARQVGLPHESHAELVAAMCTDGITSRAVVTDISGRGVGMSALLQAVTALGGTIEVESELGRGSEIRVLLPRAPPRDPPG